MKEIAKKAKSSFFPREWSPEQVVNAIGEAYDNRVHMSGNRYYGYAGKMEIEMFLDRFHKILSAYPKEEM